MRTLAACVRRVAIARSARRRDGTLVIRRSKLPASLCWCNRWTGRVDNLREAAAVTDDTTADDDGELTSANH
ncbi:hypothetical protein C8039_00150 [Halogeometricum sp. wsp3]|nr:hypothetical protein C8039_00150 [Halogeometricum sp. wsp3]